MVGQFAAELRLTLNFHVWNIASCNNKGQKFIALECLFLEISATFPETLKEFSLQPFHIEKSLKMFATIADKETFTSHLSLLH